MYLTVNFYQNIQNIKLFIFLLWILNCVENLISQNLFL